MAAQTNTVAKVDVKRDFASTARLAGWSGLGTYIALKAFMPELDPVLTAFTMAQASMITVAAQTYVEHENMFKEGSTLGNATLGLLGSTALVAGCAGLGSFVAGPVGMAGGWGFGAGLLNKLTMKFAANIDDSRPAPIMKGMIAGAGLSIALLFGAAALNDYIQESPQVIESGHFNLATPPGP